MRISLLIAMGLVVSGLGCSSGDQAVSFSTRDSAGVRIVQNPAAPRAVWTVDSMPMLDIGGDAADPAQQLAQVVAALRLSDGRVVVATTQPAEIRSFSPEGKALAVIGRNGSGPGEFQAPAWMGTAGGDSLLVFDLAHRRLTAFDSGGRYAWSYMVRSTDTAATTFLLPMGRLESGRLLAQRGEFRFPWPGAEGEVRRDSVWVFLVDSTGVADTIGRFPGNEFFGLAMNIGPGGSNVIMPSVVPFGRALLVAGTGRRIAVAPGIDYQILFYRPDGSLASLVRRAYTPRPLTAADVSRYKEYRNDQPLPRGIPQQMADAFRGAVEKAPYPGTLPPYTQLMFDPDGNLWVQSPVIVPDDPAEWMVFDSTGALVASATTPARLRVTQIGTDWLLGIWQDPDEVQHIRAYGIER